MSLLSISTSFLVHCTASCRPYHHTLAFYCCLHTLALQYRTASATESDRQVADCVIGVEVGLHDMVFYGFPYKLHPKPKIAPAGNFASLASRPMTVVFGLGMRLNLCAHAYKIRKWHPKQWIAASECCEWLC